MEGDLVLTFPDSRASRVSRWRQGRVGRTVRGSWVTIWVQQGFSPQPVSP